MIFSYHDLLYLQLSAQTIEKGCCSPFLRFCNSPSVSENGLFLTVFSGQLFAHLCCKYLNQIAENHNRWRHEHTRTI